MKHLKATALQATLVNQGMSEEDRRRIAFDGDGLLVPEQMTEQIEALLATATDQAALSMTRASLLAVIADEHAETLRRMTGNYTVEDRDTWPRQQAWADAHLAGNDRYDDLLVGLLTAAEREAAGENAATIMANRIAEKVIISDKLTSAAGNAKREAEAAVTAMATVAELESFEAALVATKADREAAFLAALAA
ncbi:hypothetical protein [Ahrensia sp. R2A130]|uniref:hypothetical protein n=1 Tax=Ahrensia sp. R2A130 TaxID=744979 RepID=UPI0001E0B4FE|nr:hypothetical protein [Ahrensia sp. R2A130]EFL88268.1 hypothetical protein R2A130_3435 [Ahrensia sp. R2A130]